VCLGGVPLLGTGPSGWYEHSMTGGTYLVRRRHVDHGLVRTCAWEVSDGLCKT
jgi:hypothetical protein